MFCSLFVISCLSVAGHTLRGSPASLEARQASEFAALIKEKDSHYMDWLPDSVDELNDADEAGYYYPAYSKVPNVSEELLSDEDDDYFGEYLYYTPVGTESFYEDDPAPPSAPEDDDPLSPQAAVIQDLISREVANLLGWVDLVRQAFAPCQIAPGECNPNHEVCPLNYEPVCGCNGITYGNACEARYVGCVVCWTDGPCAGRKA